MADLSLDLCGVKLKNPIIAASGTFGFGREYDELYDIGRLGGISVKGLSLLPRTGNPPSRIAETPSGMLNSVGLQNPGVESFIENDLPWLLTKDVAVIANITGTSVEQYVQMAERLAGTGVHLLEMNISCPNVHEGGVAFGVKPESVYAITKAVKAAAKQPLIVKLTPNVSDITENALAAEEAGADAISMINTLTGIAVDVNKRRMVLANNTGGLSGLRCARSPCAWSGRAPRRCISRSSAWAGSRPARMRRRSCSAARRPSWLARRTSPIRSPARASFGSWTHIATGRRYSARRSWSERWRNIEHNRGFCP